MVGGHITIHGQELAAWERFCFKLRLLDAWQSQSFMQMSSSLLFSRSDRRYGGVNVSRLDRFYLSDYFQNMGGMIGIMPGMTFSDHAPICLHILEDRHRKELHVGVLMH